MKSTLEMEELHVAFIDLEKAYDETDRKAMWQILQIYGVSGKLFKVVKSFCKVAEKGNTCQLG